jgi:hypothetical protein
MPGMDRTGPRGEGPRTGWGMGFCGGSRGPDLVPGRGLAHRWGRQGGRGRGRGARGRGLRLRGAGPVEATGDEVARIESRVVALRTELTDLIDRLEKLRATPRSDRDMPGAAGGWTPSTRHDR